MILRSIRVTNLRSYEEGQLDLGEGVTLLTGDVGAGKSSLLQAAETALFGPSEVHPEFLLRHGASAGEVEVTFGEGEERFSFRRRIRRRRSRDQETFDVADCSLGRNGQRSSMSATELKRAVIEMLGFPDNPNPRAHSDLWRWAVYIPQEQMREVFLSKPDARLETVRKALGVERFRVARENSLELARRLGYMEQMLRESSRNLGDPESQLGTVEAERRQLEVEEGRLGAELEAREESRRRMEAALQKLRADRTRLEAFRSRRAEIARSLSAWEERHQGLEKRLRELTDQLSVDVTAREEARRAVEKGQADAPDLSRLELSLSRRQEATVAARERHERWVEAHRKTEEISRQIADLDREITVTSGSLSEKRRRLEETRGNLPPEPEPGKLPREGAAIQADLSKVQGEISRVERERGAARAERDQIEELLRSGTCPRCHQAVDPGRFGTHRDEAEARVHALERSLADLHKALQGLEEERKLRSQFEKDETRREEARKRVEDLVGDVKRLEEQLQRLTDSRTLRDEERESARRVEEELLEAPALLARCEADEQQARQDLDAARQALHRVELARQDLASRERALEQLGSAIQRQEEARNASAQEGAGLAQAIEDLDRDAQELERTVVRDAPVEAEFDRLAGEVNGLKVRKAEAETRRKERESRIRELEGELARKRQYEQEADRVARIARWLNGPFRECTMELERQTMAQGLRMFDQEFRRFFGSLMEDSSLRAGIDSEFTPFVETMGSRDPPEALSGGERTALALSFRLALARLVRREERLKLSTLILDEPTDGFSREQLERLADLLRTLDLPQIVLISHEAELASVASTVVRVEKVDGVSRLRVDPRPEEPLASLPAAAG